MYGPDFYYGPPDPEIPFCECGESYEDCDGGCYPASLLQLTDPVTGEHPLTVHEEPEDPRIAEREYERHY